MIHDYEEMLNYYIEEYNKVFNFKKNKEKLILDYINSNIEPGEKITIWGAGEHTEELFKIRGFKNLNIVGVIDKNEKLIGQKKYGFEIKHPLETNYTEIDTIIISSYFHRKKIKDYILENEIKCRVLDIYDEFDYGFNFYNNCGLGNIVDLYGKTVTSIYKDSINMEVNINFNKTEYKNIISKYEAEIRIKSNYLYRYVDNEEKKGKIVVDILFQTPQGWPSLESLWNELNGDDRFYVNIIQLPFIHELSSEKMLESLKFLVDKGIKFLPWYLYDISKSKAHVTIFQNPYENSRPKEFKIDKINSNTKILYIPYALELGLGELDKVLHFNQELHKKAWIICSRSERHKETFIKYSKNKGTNVKVFGHPRIDAIINLDSFIIDKELVKLAKGRKTIVWNPHFTVKQDGLANWSTFNIWKDKILDIFSDRKDIFLIIRPHPLLLEKIDKEDKELISNVKEFKRRITTMENVYFDRKFDYRHAFAISNALMSDVSSFLLEYLATGKPILFLQNNNAPPLGTDGDVVDYFYKVSEEIDILNFVNMVLNDKDPLKKIRRSKIDEYLTYSDGKVGERIKEYIYINYNK